jgi:dihydrodipicolinate synthase/N-acetylneuraminate lyase
MITRENCHGAWVPIVSEWDEHDRFDVDMFARNARTMVEAGVHTIYTTGTDGEFYAMTREEFRLMVTTAVAAACGTATMIAIGTNAANTRDVLDQIVCCAEAGAGAVMPAFPFWLELGEREWLPFLKDCCAAAGSIGVMHYNTIRAKRVLGAADYAVCTRELPPNFVGSKAVAADFAQWCQLHFETPELVHIPIEASAVPILMGGGRAFISATLGAMNPKLAAAFYELCSGGKWAEAMAFQMRLNRLEHAECNQLFRRQGCRAGALSKALTRIGGHLETHNTMRNPYQAAPEHLLAQARLLVETLMPELSAGVD